MNEVNARRLTVQLRFLKIARTVQPGAVATFAPLSFLPAHVFVTLSPLSELLQKKLLSVLYVYIWVPTPVPTTAEL